MKALKGLLQVVGVCLLLVAWFGPWAVGVADLGAWALTGQQLTEVPWKEARGAVLFMWPVAFGLALLLLAALTGCDGTSAEAASRFWGRAPFTHRCTEEEMARVQREALWCKTNTGWSGDFCYGTAILRVCEPAKGATE